ncbi:MAG: signal peptidase I [Candidatus Pacebacteria bacterium]|nr:signal peptidase I [Candidatus Paceibacterota bacterium]
MKKFFLWILDLVKTIIIAIVIVIPIRIFVFQPFIVRGESMQPNFHNNDYIIVDQLSYRLREPERGEIIIFYLEDNSSQRFIKRIIGLPGEEVQIKNNQVIVSEDIVLQEPYIPASFETISDKTIYLKENEYFVLGDNRPASYDSRRFGVVSKENIIGRALINIRFFQFVSLIKTPNYD